MVYILETFVDLNVAKFEPAPLENDFIFKISVGRLELSFGKKKMLVQIWIAWQKQNKKKIANLDRTYNLHVACPTALFLNNIHVGISNIWFRYRIENK